MKKCFYIALCFCVCYLPGKSCAQTATLEWDSLNLADNTSISQGAQVTKAGVTMTVTWYTIVNGGTFVPHSSYNDFVVYKNTSQGGHTGWAAMNFDNSNNDPNDKVVMKVKFSTPLDGLTFSMSDVDIGTGGTPSWKDAVEVFYNGNNNVKSNGGITVTRGSAVVNDNETYMDGWEGNANVATNSSNGNITFNFGSVQVDSIMIVYFSSDDATSNPQPQQVGVTDFTFNLQLMPVFFSWIKATGSNKGNKIQWQTASETNCHYFAIEKSTDGGNSFWETGIVAARGNSLLPTDYSYTDSAAHTKTYYRLKAVDFDNSYFFSNPVCAYANTGFAEFAVYPSAFCNQLTIDNYQRHEAFVAIHHANGKLADSFCIAANNAYTLNTYHYPTGIYYLVITNNKIVLKTFKLIKL